MIKIGGAFLSAVVMVLAINSCMKKKNEIVDIVYNVESGDCLSEIFNQFGIYDEESIESILLLNGIENENSITAGQQIYS